VRVPYLLEKGISEETTTFDLDRSMATFVPKLLVLPFTLMRSLRKVSWWTQGRHTAAPFRDKSPNI